MEREMISFRQAARLTLTTLALVLAAPAVAFDEFDEFESTQRNPDPWEPVNRVIFNFNDRVDSVTLKPIARGYGRIVPEPVRDGVSNFFNNLGEPRNMVNSALQGKFHEASVDMSRFLLNTTLGVGGFFDLATRWGLQRNDEDLGQTLGSYGTPSGPYVVLPLLGPSTLRDAAVRVPETFASYTYRSHVDHVPTRNTAFATELVDIRSSVLAQERLIRGDRYTFVRNAFLQNREFRVRDGMVEDEF
jgi:phospholipid-binding lipoprotein MlaA